MNEKKEFKRIYGFAKSIISKDILKKIKSLDNFDDKMEVLRYALKIQLDHNYEKIKSKVKVLEDIGKEEAFYLLIKTSLLRSKIKLFDATFHNTDYLNMMKLFNEIEKGVKHV